MQPANKLARVAVLLVTLAVCAFGQKPNFTHLDDVLRSAVERDRVPGVVASASINGAPYSAAFGLNRDAIFRIASMTKAITSVAVMQLVDAGKVRLDEPANTYAPELGKVQVLDHGKLRDPKTSVTIRQLLSHTSGFGYEFFDPEMAAWVQAGKLPSILAGGDGFLSAPLLFDPGTHWEYGISVDWLGRIVEHVSGKSLESYFHENIFEPLGMSDTTFDLPAEKRSRLVTIYRRQNDGSLAAQPQPEPTPVKFYSGGGGLYSTAADYMKFLQMLLKGGYLGGKRIITAESLAEMGRNQIGAMTLQPLRSLIPQFAKDNALVPGGLDKFGLGFAINSQAQPQGRAANSLAWAGIYNTFFWLDYERKVVAVLMMQLLPFTDDVAVVSMQAFERGVYAAH